MVDALLGSGIEICEKQIGTPRVAVCMNDNVRKYVGDTSFGGVCAICTKTVDPLNDSRRCFTCPACKKMTPPMHMECALTTNARHRGGDPLTCSITDDSRQPSRSGTRRERRC